MTPTILIVIEPNRSYERGLLKGILHYSKEHGDIHFVSLPPHYLLSNKESVSRKIIRSIQPDGIILREGVCGDVLTFRNIPLIFSPFQNRDLHFSRILSDDHAIAKEAYRHFIAIGVKEFAFVGFSDFFWSVARMRALEELTNKDVRKFLFKGEEWGRTDVAIKNWLKRLPVSVGVMCATDEIAVKVIDLCLQSNINVPEEIAVLGVDNDEFICEMSQVTISSIHHYAEIAGYRAALELHQCIVKRQALSEVIMSPEVALIQRSSTDHFYSENRFLTGAIKFIHQHITRGAISIDAICKVSGCSRRYLEELFRKEVSVSIKTYLDNKRLELIKQLLAGNELSIFEISVQLGFSGQDSLCRFFKRLMGITPMEYRIALKF